MRELADVLLCHEMRWSYTEMRQQPSWFLQLMRIKIDEDAKHRNRELKRQERRAKR